MRRLLTVSACLMFACLPAAAAEQQPATALGPVHARADTVLRPISRDGGFSVQYSKQPARSLWLFGDTSQKNGPPFIGGTTAAIAAVVAGKAPTDMAEVPTPPTMPASPLPSPQPFFPTPVGLGAPGSAGRAMLPCGAHGSGSLYPAAWPTGGARIPRSSKVLLVYFQVCVTSKAFPVERLSLTIYDPQHNQFLSSWTPFVAKPLSAGLARPEALESPVFGGDGYLYLYAHEPLGGVYVARVSSEPSAWGNASSYAWWSAPPQSEGRWSSDETAASSLVSGIPVFGASVSDLGATTLHKFVMLIQTGFRTAEFALYEAPAPAGPWSAGPTGRVPDACAIGVFGCYALNLHPELSTREQVVYSWYSPGKAPDQGRINLGAVRW